MAIGEIIYHYISYSCDILPCIILSLYTCFYLTRPVPNMDIVAEALLVVLATAASATSCRHRASWPAVVVAADAMASPGEAQPGFDGLVPVLD